MMSLMLEPSSSEVTATGPTACRVSEDWISVGVLRIHWAPVHVFVHPLMQGKRGGPNIKGGAPVQRAGSCLAMLMTRSASAQAVYVG